MTPAVMAHEVVSGALAGPREPREGDAEHSGAQNAVGAAGKTLPFSVSRVSLRELHGLEFTEHVAVRLEPIGRAGSEGRL